MSKEEYNALSLQADHPLRKRLSPKYVYDDLPLEDFAKLWAKYATQAKKITDKYIPEAPLKSPLTKTERDKLFAEMPSYRDMLARAQDDQLVIGEQWDLSYGGGDNSMSGQ